MTWKDTETGTFGEPPSQPPYDDLDKVYDLTHLPDNAFHRDVDKIVLDAHSDTLKEVIVCPPMIYGPGRGPGNKRSRQVYGLARITLELGQAPQAGRGLTEWDNVHIHDLSNLIVLLVEAALSPTNKDNPEIWGEKGYFLAENGHHVWGEVSKEVAKAAYKQGYIKTADVLPMSRELAFEKGGFNAVSWGLNSRGLAKRARKVLGWKPTGKSLNECIPDIVDGEAKILGMKKGYAETVSA